MTHGNPNTDSFLLSALDYEPPFGHIKFFLLNMAKRSFSYLVLDYFEQTTS